MQNTKQKAYDKTKTKATNQVTLDHRNVNHTNKT